MARKKKEVDLHSTQMCDDNYMKSFKPEALEMTEMSEFLKDIESKQQWLKLQLVNIGTTVESGGGLLLEDIKSRYRFYGEPGDDAILSTIENGKQIGTQPGAQVFVVTKDIDPRLSLTLLLADTGLSSLILRSGVDCSAISKANILEKKTMIDIGLKHSGEKETLALYSCGKIRTFNGGNTYAILKQSTMFDGIIKMLQKEKKKFQFKGGYYSHTRTEATFELTEGTDEILETYKNACKEIKSIKSKGLKVEYSFATSDVGEECATISVALARGQLKMLLGSPIRVPHNGDNTAEKFVEQLPLLLAKTKDLVKGLENLINIEIKNPINCMLTIAKEAGLSKSQTLASVATFQTMMDEAAKKKQKVKYSAHDVFYVLQETLMEMRKANVAESTIEKCEENIARTLIKEYDWNERDVAVRPEWSTATI